MDLEENSLEKHEDMMRGSENMMRRDGNMMMESDVDSMIRHDNIMLESHEDIMLRYGTEDNMMLKSNIHPHYHYGTRWSIIEDTCLGDIRDYILPGCYGLTSQVVISFFLGILFAPWSYGLLYLIIFFIIYEIVYFCICTNYNVIDRILITLSYFVGFFFARILFCDELVRWV